MLWPASTLHYFDLPSELDLLWSTFTFWCALTAFTFWSTLIDVHIFICLDLNSHFDLLWSTFTFSSTLICIDMLVCFDLLSGYDPLLSTLVFWSALINFHISSTFKYLNILIYLREFWFWSPSTYFDLLPQLISFDVSSDFGLHSSAFPIWSVLIKFQIYLL